MQINADRYFADGLKDIGVVITRAEHQAQELAQLLEEKGAVPILYPCIQILPASDLLALEDALQKAGRGDFDWVIITSTNAAVILGQRMKELGISLGKVKVAAVGPKTAEAVKGKLHVEVDLVPESYRAEGIIEALPPMRGKSVLLPQGDLARPILARALRLEGAEVSDVETYRIGIGQGGAPVPKMLSSGRIDAIIFSSPTTVRNFLERVEREGGRKSDLKDVCLAAIGPVTAQSMRDEELRIDVQPPRYTLAECVNALAAHYSRASAQTTKNNRVIHE